MENLTLWLELIITLLSVVGLVAPLLIALVKYVKIAAKEKNWRVLIKHVMALIGDAEEFTHLTGTAKKAFVMAKIEEMTEQINYEISDEELSELIDTIVDLTSKVNVVVDSFKEYDKAEENGEDYD